MCKGSCCFISGFIAALLLGGAVLLVLFLRKNPDAKKEGLNQMEKKWEQTKETGDKTMEKIKEAAQ